MKRYDVSYYIRYAFVQKVTNEIVICYRSKLLLFGAFEKNNFNYNNDNACPNLSRNSAIQWET